ncbi:RagB/SusD family nutrient uptake outer membrane protein [Flavihumibacter rivuli]|uniref:RagB/SusD family nutrient uptake outer membrane protein n=1 Tax=Flavihumibacter rivuli TaxID=2838156 RepID=UPI001BDE880C|nr:RagB/SusD family nutrient uptake outer membrane protein [Flavihumibacter rivuli]ULQ55447.1 RagB/SusD family nutrient uptake outer membrane protein [Flavihumibacter rivuli]
MRLPKIIVGIFLVAHIMGCEKMVEVAPPKYELTGDMIFSNRENAEAYLANVYTKAAQAAFPYVSNPMNLYCDDIVYNGNNASLLEFYQGLVNPINLINENQWKSIFATIYYANNWLNAEGKLSAIPLDVRNQITGELLTLRAKSYFDLMVLYGEVPLVLTADFNQSAKLNNADSAVLVSQMYKDLFSAMPYLNGNYPSSDRVRINKFVAQAYLARLALYNKEWELAYNYSDSIINSGLYSLEKLDRVFKVGSDETLFCYWNKAGYTDYGLSYVTDPGVVPEYSISENLLKEFGSDDLRSKIWLNDDIQNQLKTPFKYRNRSEVVNGESEYLVDIRLSEIYLIRAEASANLGNLTLALKDLNEVRRRAGCESLPAIVSYSEFLEQLLLERRRELFTEGYLRFYDLKRNGKMDSLLGYKPSWKAHCVRLPFPYNEILNNANLRQNPGY